MHLNMRQMYLKGLPRPDFSCRCGAAGAEAAMATDRLALGAIIRQNIGMTEDEGEKTQ
jgi:hypothetical protein